MTPQDDLGGDIDRVLTDRQRETLKAAVTQGFFDRPQEATAADVAETLDLARTTFLYHLRNGERELLQSLFDSDSSSDD